VRRKHGRSSPTTTRPLYDAMRSPSPCPVPPRSPFVPSAMDASPTRAKLPHAHATRVKCRLQTGVTPRTTPIGGTPPDEDRISPLRKEHTYEYLWPTGVWRPPPH